MNYHELSDILSQYEFDDYFINNVIERDAAFEIDYGPQKGGITGTVNDFINQHPILYGIDDGYYGNFVEMYQCQMPGDENLVGRLLYCIKVLDWGQMQKGNIRRLFELYDENLLSNHLNDARAYFEDENAPFEVVHEPDTANIWSSGWTKIYSLSSQFTCIYDSRVAAFLNYVIYGFMRTGNHSDIHDLRFIVSKLSNRLTGNNIRVRRIDDAEWNAIGGVNTGTRQHKFIANKLASMIIRYLSELDGVPGNSPQEKFRKLDQAFFMLGFDLAQLPALPAQNN